MATEDCYKFIYFIYDLKVIVMISIFGLSMNGFHIIRNLLIAVGITNRGMVESM